MTVWRWRERGVVKIVKKSSDIICNVWYFRYLYCKKKLWFLKWDRIFFFAAQYFCIYLRTTNLSAGPSGLTCVTVSGLHMSGSEWIPPRNTMPRLPSSRSMNTSIILCFTYWSESRNYILVSETFVPEFFNGRSHQIEKLSEFSNLHKKCFTKYKNMKKIKNSLFEGYLSCPRNSWVNLRHVFNNIQKYIRLRIKNMNFNVLVFLLMAKIINIYGYNNTYLIHIQINN